jgi:hypothetical protein
LDDRFRIEEQKSAVATATAARDPNSDIAGSGSAFATSATFLMSL